MRRVFVILLLAQSALAAPDDRSSLPTAPSGWKLELVAAAPQVRHPSVVCTAPDGRVFVAEDPMDISAPSANLAQGRILCLHTDGRITIFAERLHAVFGMQYIEGKLYVLHNPKFSVFTDDDSVGKDRVDLIESTNPNPWALDWNDHVPANFRLAMDGFLYVAVGDKGVYGAVGRDGKRVDLHGGGILRLRPDGTELEVYCTGVRNILDVALNAEDEIFTYDNTDEQQWMGRLTHMVEAGFYGYPYEFIPHRPYTLWMMADYGGGAATGALSYDEDALPSEYRGNLFLADFGKRQLLRVRVAREAGTFRAVSKEEMFANPPEAFRPVGIALAPDGRSIYICDWQHRDTKENVAVGRLLKLSYTGQSMAAPKPKWYVAAAMGKPFEATARELVEAFSHPSRNVRLVAQRRVAERAQFRSSRREEAHSKAESQSLLTSAATDSRAETARLLIALLNDQAAPAQARWHAIWALDALDAGQAGRRAILSAASDKDASVRRQAIRQLGTRKVAAASSVLLRRLKDEDAAVRFQAATALGRIGKRSAVPALSRGLEQTDLFPRYAVFAALNRIGRQDPAAWREIAKGLESGSAALREGTEFALRETYDTALLDALVPIARNSHKPEPTREAALRLLAALHHQKPAWKGEWWAYHPVNAAPPAKTVEWPGTARVLQTLRAALDDSSARVRRAALAGLRDANDATASARLRELFTVETDPEARRLIVAALGVTKDAEARGLIASLLAPSTPRALLGEALTAAQNLAGPQIESALIQLLESGPGDNALLKQTLDSVGALKIARSVPALTNYAAHSSEEVRTAALRALLKVDTNKATLLILPLLDHASADVRRSATAALGSAKSRAVIPALLRAFADRETRSEAIVALAKTPSIEALEAYLDGLRHENPPVRDAARNAIRAIQEQALPLIEARASQLSLEALGALKQVYAKNERARELFAAAPKPIEPADYLAYALQSAGDAEVGRSLFHDGSRLACTKCHVVGSEGGRIGPDLTTAGAQFSRRELAESVLFPSRAMREGYQAVLIETREGESISGLFKSETADELSLTDSEGKPHHFRKADIAHRRLSELSLMPEGLQTGLTMQQFAGLISFLESLKPEAAAAMLNQPPPGFTALFNGRDLAGWKADANTAAHWRARDGVLEHDGVERDLWTQQSFGDFVLLVDWRWPDEPKWEESPIIGPDGNEVVGLDGKVKTERVLDAGDSGIFLRGYRKAQANLFCYPVGSGEVWEYRTDSKMPAEVRRAVTPKKKADKPVGAWNRMKITMEGDHLTVELNDEEVISSALLPGIPARGPIGFQHEHGRIQFRNMFVKELRLDR